MFVKFHKDGDIFNLDHVASVYRSSKTIYPCSVIIELSSGARQSYTFPNSSDAEVYYNTVVNILKRFDDGEVIGTNGLLDLLPEKIEIKK